MRAANGTRILRSETGRNPLRIKDCDGIWNTRAYLARDGSSNFERTGRTLPPKHAAPFTQKKLLDLAAEYDAGIAKLEPRPSEATRNLRKET